MSGEGRERTHVGNREPAFGSGPDRKVGLAVEPGEREPGFGRGSVGEVLVVEGAPSLGHLAELERGQEERILAPGGELELARVRRTVRQGVSGEEIVRHVEA